MTVLDVNGTDITELTRATAANAGIPHALLVACMYGESKSFDPRSERWGTATADAQAAIARSDWARLQQIITAAGNDVSFGRCHRIVKYHWAGNQQYTTQNCLAVRQAVWADPERDLREMASWLAADYKRAQAQDLTLVKGDVQLATCLIYNRGHEVVDPAEFTAITVRTDNYRAGLAKAAELLAQPDGGVHQAIHTEEVPMTIEEKAQQMTTDGDRLGNGGVPYSPVCEWETSAGLLRFQQFWLGNLLEYPTQDGNRDVATYPEGTLNADDLARFQGHPA